VIQEAFLDATAALPQFVEKAEMPFFLWLRWLTGMKLNALQPHAPRLAGAGRGREVSINQGPWPQATSAAWPRSSWAPDQRQRGRHPLEHKARLQQALDTMDPLDREVLILRHFEELTNAEAARRSHPGPAASKRYIRALRKLKDILTSRPGGSKEFRR